MDPIFTDADERAALVANASAELALAPWVVEKDLWVCWLLARLHELPRVPGLTFKGGTSLSKVYGLIQRFSEDIDLTFSREGWGFDGERDPLAPGLSGKARARLVDEIAACSVAVVRDIVVPGLRVACVDCLGELGWAIDVADDDSQAVLFTYPTPTASYSYGRPVVKAEFGARGDPWPTISHVVQPLLEDVTPAVALSARAEVVTLAAERTFWEKATLLHAIHHGTLTRPDKRVDRLSRHLYDLHQIWHQPELRARLLENPGLLQAVVRNKAVFFKEGKARYDLVEGFGLNAVPHPDLEARLREDYDAMESMFFPDSTVPAFDELLSTLAEIDATVGEWGG